MPLRERAVLEVDRGDSTAVFEFADGLEETTTVEKRYLVSERGQYAQEIWDQVSDFDPRDETTEDVLPETNRRIGYHLDGGAGSKERTISFTTGNEADSIMWGDQESATGPDNVTVTDASGAGVSQYDRLDVWRYWMAEARTDSQVIGRFYYNQWSDGTYGTDAGAHGKPMPVVVTQATAETRVEAEGVTGIEGTVTLLHASEFPEAVDDAIDSVTDALDEHLDYG